MKMVFLPPQTPTTTAWIEKLQQRFPDDRFEAPADETAALASLGGSEAAFGTMTPALLAAADSLRWLQAPAAAPPAGFYFDQLIAHSATVTNFRGIYNDHISYHVLGMILSFTKHLHDYRDLQHRHEWKPLTGPAYNTIYPPECTVLIVGMGGIGAETARVCKAIGMRIVGTDARVTEAPPDVDELHPADRLFQLAGQADFVVSTIPHTPHSEGLFDAAFFRAMKSSGIFINIGRGMTTRLEHLDAALRTGTIAGAGLDVFEIEPLPDDHPLWDAPNTLITPHVAVLDAAYLDDRRFAILEDNVKRFRAGEPLVNVVDKSVWF